MYNYKRHSKPTTSHQESNSSKPFLCMMQTARATTKAVGWSSSLQLYTLHE
jgi:hypothetical protein